MAGWVNCCCCCCCGGGGGGGGVSSDGYVVNTMEMMSIDNNEWMMMEWRLPRAMASHSITVIDYHMFLISATGAFWYRPVPLRYNEPDTKSSDNGWQRLLVNGIE